MISLPTLILVFAAVAVLLTIIAYLARRRESMFMTFMQFFCGVWFLFSGAVKAVDPRGTGYKMVDYFEAFSSTAKGTAFAWLEPIFSWMSSQALAFSIFMIVLEVAVGIMLIVGYKRKLAAWLFFLILVFFTLLTGFTYLSGYVPLENNFFDFAKWGPYNKSQMRVTDCGCFGEFLKLDPKISFFKDLGLMIPAFIFLFGFRKMHHLWTVPVRATVSWVTILGSLAFCYYNSFMNLPVIDFRAFKEGTNVRAKKILEADALTNIDIIGYIMENTKTGEVKKIMSSDIMQIYKENPKTDGWKVKDQVKTDPAIIDVTGYEIFNPNTQETKTVNVKTKEELYQTYPDSLWQVRKELGQRIPYELTKISDFRIEDPGVGAVTDDILNEKGYSMMIVLFHIDGKEDSKTITVQDTSWAVDTIRVPLPKVKGVARDSFYTQRRMASVEPKQVTKRTFIPDAKYADMVRNNINPLAEQAEKAGWKVYAVTHPFSPENREDFRHATQSAYPLYEADDKLLKTITRSNPGIVIWKDGVIVGHYHHKHLPSFSQIANK